MTWQRMTTVPRLTPRAADSHKGTYGKVLIVAGSIGLSGAAVLAGTAALRGGAGLVQLAVPAPVQPVVAAAQPCYMAVPLPADAAGRLNEDAVEPLLGLAKQASAVVLGPGLGQSRALTALVRTVFRKVSAPLVVDADGLNALGPHPPELRQRSEPFLLTPHPGEFGRLTGTDARTVQSQREELAQAFVQQHGGVLVLKGAGTIVCACGRIYLNTTGNPGMATGGTGDVLAGLLGALLAGGMDAFEAAVLGVYLHGLAGDLACAELGETSMLATDVLEALPRAIQRSAN